MCEHDEHQVTTTEERGPVYIYPGYPGPLTINQKCPENSRIEPHHHRAQEDLPRGRVAVSTGKDTERPQVGMLRICRASANASPLDMQRLFEITALVAQLVEVQAPVVVTTQVIIPLDDHRKRDVSPPVRRLGDQEDDAEHEHPEEDGAHAKGPPVAIELDNISRDERAARDAGEEEQVPDGDARGALVDKVQVADGALNEDLVRRHAEAADDPAREEGPVAGDGGAPDAAREHDADGGEVDGPPADDLGERVREEQRQPDGEDDPRRELREGLDRDAQLGRDLYESGGQHGAVCSDDGGREAYDDEDHLFLPGIGRCGQLSCL